MYVCIYIYVCVWWDCVYDVKMLNCDENWILRYVRIKLNLLYIMHSQFIFTGRLMHM